MPDTLRDNWLFILIPMVAALLGGGLTLVRPVSERVRSLVQHIAAGVVFAAVADELLPDVVNADLPLATAIGFALGIGLLLIFRQLAEKNEQPLTNGATPLRAGATERAAPNSNPPAGLPTGLLAAFTVDMAVDGLLVGIGFTAGRSEGILLTIALTLEVAFLGTAIVVSLAGAGMARGPIVVSLIGMTLVLGVAAALGAGFVPRLSPWLLDATLSFGVAALLYLVTEELLVKAHEVPETPATAASFFAGFLALLLIGMSI